MRCDDLRCAARAINGASGGTVGIANAYIADAGDRGGAEKGHIPGKNWGESFIKQI